jgi:hypothetical protein
MPLDAEVPDSFDWSTYRKATKEDREVDNKTDSYGDVNGNIELLAELQSEHRNSNPKFHCAHRYAVAEDGKIAVHHDCCSC